MGIQIEFNPDLALRKFNTPGRRPEECLPKILEVSRVYDFLKSGQRNYWLEGEIPLLETKGNQQLSRPLASVKIVEAKHFIGDDGLVWTKGKFRVLKVFDPEDSTVHFESYKRVGG